MKVQKSRFKIAPSVCLLRYFLGELIGTELYQVPSKRLPGEGPDDEHCVWCITVECYEQYHLICSSKLPLQIGSVDELIFPMLGF